VAVVVDTDVVSFLYKQDDRAAFYLPYLSNQLPIISFMTLAELERWTLAGNWGERKRQHLMKYLRRYTVCILFRPSCVVSGPKSPMERGDAAGRLRLPMPGLRRQRRYWTFPC
jgi:hypothetical protein